MKNFIKEFFRKIKEKKAQMNVSNYGDISIECIYHDHFIKIMDTFNALEKGTIRPKGSEVYSTESAVKTSVKGESLILNSSSNIFKESVLCAISENSRNFLESRTKANEVSIEECSNIILKLTIHTGTTAVLDFINIFKAIVNNLSLEVKIPSDTGNDDSIIIIIYGSCLWFRYFEEYLTEYKLLDDNIVAIKIIECVKSIIPEYGTNNGRSYFTGLEDTVGYIEPYHVSKDNVQVLSYTKFDNVNLKEYISKDNTVFSMQQLYLVIDNAGCLTEAFKFCDIVKRMPTDNRYLIRIPYNNAYYFIYELEHLELADNVKKNMRDNIISIIKNIIPVKALNPESYEDEYEDPEYASVDEIIED